MKVRLLGTAAGGGFPQWNCACPNCDGLRRGTIRARPRREFCVAVTGNDRDWFLINAPPDVHAQIASFPPLAPRGNIRSTSIAGVLLTSADLDNVLGLMVLREGPPLTIHATAGIRRALRAGGLSVSRLLSQYAPPIWQDPPTSRSPLLCASGGLSGLDYEAALVDSHPPRYLHSEHVTREFVADRIGYVIWDAASGSRVVALPGVLTFTPELRKSISGCDLLLLDGTFWSDDELRRKALRARTAKEMGHVPVSGLQGSAGMIKSLKARRTIYVHINNTNPMLNEDSPEHRAVSKGGAEVGYDGLEIEL